MNTFNRAAMILILLGIIASTIIGILALLFVPSAFVPLFSNLAGRLGASQGDARLRDLQLELTITGLILFVPSIILLLLELRRTARDSIRISKVSGSEAHLSTQAVAQSLIYYVDALEGVVRVKPRLQATGKVINVRLDVQTTPDVDVRAKTEQITQTTRNLIEERLGLKLNRLHIHIHHTPFPQGAGVPAMMRPVPANGPPERESARLPSPAVPAEKQNPLP
ncbi:MAG: hypothetical protein E6J26_08645 [Chloroflexi bacterium]|nr:MAG: hypothetical protein E6J26_08645 [Chloroflexota bacterium]